MTEQIHEDQHMGIQTIEPLRTRYILAQNWTSPAKTLAVGSIIGLLCLFMIPVYGMTYVIILIPICILTAITQLSIGIIKEIQEHKDSYKRKPMR